MRKFYKSTADNVIEVVSKDEQLKITVADAQTLVDSGDAIIYDTLGELNETIAYQKGRRDEYPSIQDQLDKMYHDGFDAWKVTIKAVKDAHPKP